MKYCPYCGESLPDPNALFCPECGKATTGDLEESPVQDEGYDGYYDDVLPVDSDRQREGPDQLLIRKIALLIGSVFLIIGGCVLMLSFL